MAPKKKKSELDIQVPKSAPGAQIEVKNEKLFKLPTVATLTGAAGKGKTTAAANLIRMFREENLCDRLIVVSNTTSSNRGFFSELGLPVDENDIIDPNSGDAVGQISSIIEQERDDYRQYLIELESYKAMLDKRKPQTAVEAKQRNLASSIVTIRQGMAEVAHPKTKHRHKGKKPVIWALFDDCQGSKTFKHNSGLGKLVISHRHQGQFPEEFNESPLGLSAVFTVQNFRDRADGIPRPVRTNSSLICVFFTRDERERQAIAEEASGVTDQDTLIDRLDSVTKPFDPSFLLIDKSPINPHSELGVFRKCFDGPVEPPPEITGKPKSQKPKARRNGKQEDQEAER